MKPLSDELKAEVRKLAANTVAICVRASEELKAKTNEEAQLASMAIQVEFQAEVIRLVQEMG